MNQTPKKLPRFRRNQRVEAKYEMLLTSRSGIDILIKKGSEGIVSSPPAKFKRKKGMISVEWKNQWLLSTPRGGIKLCKT